jgi:hypothetical protein
MENEIIPYIEMCQREGISLQRGMNYRCNGKHSIILMSIRPNAPYHDQVTEDGTVLIYEGHDVPRNSISPNPKAFDQPERTPHGTLTENGKFFQAAMRHKELGADPEKVKVYEKIKGGIWSYNGIFALVDAWREKQGNRYVFKFKLNALDDEESTPTSRGIGSVVRRRVIPTPVKFEVWKRDGGKCTICGATDELHYDHIIPYSKGGTSLSADNIQLLCARHNLAKRDKIE